MGRQQGVLPPHVIIMQLVCHQQGVLRKGVILPHTKKCRTRWPVGSVPDIFSTGPHPSTTTRLRFESTGGNAFSISSRYVTSFPASILRTSATALRTLYGIVRRICRTLINQTSADRCHILSVPQIITPSCRGRGKI